MEDKNKSKNNNNNNKKSEDYKNKMSEDYACNARILPATKDNIYAYQYNLPVR
jgi:hypothetical protein